MLPAPAGSGSLQWSARLIRSRQGSACSRTARRASAWRQPRGPPCRPRLPWITLGSAETRGVRLCFLENEADIRPHPSKGSGVGPHQRRAEQIDFAVIRPGQAKGRTEGGRLAGAIGPDQRDGFAPPNKTSSRSTTGGAPLNDLMGPREAASGRACWRWSRYRQMRSSNP
jgi:hypothetical protein